MHQDVFFLSVIQGITEFLPVSSTAHLIVLSQMFHLPTLGRLTEVTLHAGTLLVVFAYFWKDMRDMVEGLFGALQRRYSAGFWLFLHICVATLPVIFAGYIVHKYAGTEGRSLAIMGISSIIFGSLLYIVDQRGSLEKTMDQMTVKEAFLIGLIQVFALIPGASRSGTTLIGARLLGYKRQEAARFSFLLSVPVILGATTLLVLDITKEHSFVLTHSFLISFLVSFSVGLLVLSLFMKSLRCCSLAPFALYRIIFGVFLVYYAFFA